MDAPHLPALLKHSSMVSGKQERGWRGQKTNKTYGLYCSRRHITNTKDITQIEYQLKPFS